MVAGEGAFENVCLAVGLETDDDVAWLDVLVVDYVCALHAAGHRRIHDDCAHLFVCVCVRARAYVYV